MDSTTSKTAAPATGPDTELQPTAASPALLAQFGRPAFEAIDEPQPTTPSADAGDKPVEAEGGDKPAEGGDKPAEGGDKPAEGGDKPPGTPPALPSLDDIKLSPQAKPATTAAFDAVKAAARAREAALQRQIDELTQKLGEIEKTPKLNEDVERELRELRAHRDATAVEGDPVFNAKWSKPIETAETKVFSALKSAGADADLLAEIQRVATQAGGLHQIDWDPILKAYPSARFQVTRHVGEYADAADEKRRAAEEAKANQQKWSETRQQALKEVIEGDLNKESEKLNALLDSFPVLQSKDPALKPVYDKVREKATGALRSEGKAELAAGMALSFYYKHLADTAATKLAEAEKNQPAELAAAKKQVAELTAAKTALEKELRAYRGATPRLTPRTAPAAPSEKPTTARFSAPVGALLDEHLAAGGGR